MEIYERSWDDMSEVQSEAVLVIEDDGRFSYDEGWYCYGGGGGYSARGVWWQDGGELFFRCDYSDRKDFATWVQNETKKAVKTDDSIEFDGNFKMNLRLDKNARDVEASVESETTKTPEKGEVFAANAQTVKPSNETAANDPAESSEKKSQPRIAKLYFKDGSVQERTLPKNSMVGLFTQAFYRLIDDNGNATNIFELRQNAGDQDASIVEYDEINLPAISTVDD